MSAHPSLPTDPPLPMMRPWWWRIWRALGRFERWLASYVLDNDPRVLIAWTPLLLLSLILFTRHPATNFIFDEQEALLSNPYVTGSKGLRYWDAIKVDFWGLPPDASIGSYRPLPNFLWRATWSLHWRLPPSLVHLPKHPFFHHLYNIALHSLNGALLAAFAFAVTRRRSVGWLAGLAFVASALLTEAVSGIVGLADVLGGLGALIALNALRLPAWSMPFGVFVGVVIGMFSKESALVCVPLIPAAALVTAPLVHEQRPMRVLRSLLAFAAALAAFVLYVELRKQWFPSPLPEALRADLPEHAGRLKRLFHELMVWFHQAPLPKDPLNNPLAAEGLDFKLRVAGALRVYWRGLVQVVFPWHLSGDYSYPQEPAPENIYGWESIAGAAAMVLPPLVALGLWLRALVQERRDRRSLAAGNGDALLALLPHRAVRGGLLRAGLCLLAAGSSGLVTELVMIRRGDAGGVRTWPWCATLCVTGIGLVLEGSGGVKTPLVPGTLRGWPWPYPVGSLLALGLVWIVVSYFPHSNIPILLPTVRAERFWYFPVIGSSLALAVLWGSVAERWPQPRILKTSSLPAALATLFFGFQCVRAYLHAMDYRDDLAFWLATKKAVPNSAKAHLNYSVMVGARDTIPNHMEIRLAESHVARSLAPKWPMAHIYTGDTLCRMHRAEEAWPHYKAGFELDPNAKSLIALALQCMYSEKILLAHEDDLRAIIEEHPGNTWLAFLVNDTIENHEKNHGVSKDHLPRGYNQGADESTK